jgi:hypothetical protein
MLRIVNPDKFALPKAFQTIPMLGTVCLFLRLPAQSTELVSRLRIKKAFPKKSGKLCSQY